MYSTGNPVPSSALEDMSDNAQVFDGLVTKTSGTVIDRLGNTRRSFQQVVMDMGFNPVAGSFQSGATVTEYNQCLLDESTGTFYSWNGSLPKVVSAGSTPATAGGIGALLWVDRTDLMLRTELATTSGNKYLGAVSSVSALRGLTGLSSYVGRKIQLVGYYSGAPGVGGGDLIITSDNTSADNGGTIFVTTDGVRLKRPRKMRLYSSDFGVVGDWNGTTGTDNKTAIEAMISASNSSQPWCIDQDNVGVSSIVIDSKDNWVGIISGSVINISAKPVAGASDAKELHGGVYPTFKITNCDNWTVKGGYVDNRYREAFYITNCTKFVNECDIKGSGINNNLKPNYYRYCYNFSVRKFRHEGMSEKPATGYYDWVGDIWLWDCSNIKLIDFDIFGGGSNGLYIASNCRDFFVDDFIITACGMSGIQLAWSGFGLFPYRGSISNGLINGCRSDGIDVNNSSGARAFAKLTLSNITSVNNGYDDDGTVTADGSGIATLNHVTHVDIFGCNTEDSARAGLYINDCNNIHTYGGSVRKEKTSNNSGEGVYIQDSEDIYVSGLDVKMASGQEALKLYGACKRMRIGGKYDGTIAIPTPDATTTYDDVKLKDATLVTPSEIQGYIPFVDCKVIASSSNGLRVYKEAINTDVKSNSGIATIFGAEGAKVRGGKHQGSNSGTYCGSFAGCTLDGAECIGGTGPGSHWVATAGSVITNNKITAGTGNSILTDSACTGTIKFGNALSGSTSLGGTFNINF